MCKQHISLVFLLWIAVAPSSPHVSTPTVRRRPYIIMNNTIDALVNFTAIPVALFRTAADVLPISYVQIPHVKLKAEHQALVLWHIVKIGFAYWEGWRDGKKTKDSDDSTKKVNKEMKRKRRRIKAKRGNKIVMRGKYTVIFQ
jgi:hypothetical protein